MGGKSLVAMRVHVGDPYTPSRILFNARVFAVGNPIACY